MRQNRLECLSLVSLVGQVTVVVAQARTERSSTWVGYSKYKDRLTGTIPLNYFSIFVCDDEKSFVTLTTGGIL
jgi:hypothetical protein